MVRGEGISKVSALPVPYPISHEVALPERFAAYVMPRHEERMAQHLSVRQIEHFLPLYQSRRNWKDASKADLHLPLFPGNVFVRTLRNRRAAALEVPGVLSAVGRPDASRISHSYIHSLLSGLRLGQVE